MVDFANNVFFGTTSDFFLENSYQQTFLSGVVAGWYTINMDSPTNASTCDYSLDLHPRRSSRYQCWSSVVQLQPQGLCVSSNGCDWWGLSSVGGTPSRSWITGKLEIGVTAHELGHSLGLWHSHSLDCGASAVIGANCATNEYGDIVDMMGASHFRSLQRFPEGAFGLAQRGRIAADDDRRFKRNLYSRDIRVTHFWAKSVQDPKID